MIAPWSAAAWQPAPIKFGSDFNSSIVRSAVVGGTVARLSGGKFVNGAGAAAFGYLFNYCAHNGCFDRRFTLADAIDQWRNGNGGTVTDVKASELNFNGATWNQSSKDPSTWYASLSMEYEPWAIYGTVSGKVGLDGMFTLNPDTYDFDIKWSQGLSFRNAATAVGAVINGSGTPFKIDFTGSVKPPQWAYDKTYGGGAQ